MNLSGRRLTLSFDNGPFADVTPGVLKALEERDLRASFFVTGNFAVEPGCRELMEQVRAAGLVIGNHTHTHSIELGTSDDPALPEAEIGAAQAALGDFAAPERWFRPFGGGGIIGPNLLSAGAVEYLKQGAYSVVLWNSVQRDWENPEGWPETALEHAAENDWTLVVLHDVPTGAMNALPRFLDTALERGLEIVQEFPPDCVPIVAGEAVRPLDAFVSQ